MAHVEQPHLRLGHFTAPSYIGKTWAPERVNIVSTPWARATCTASSPL